MAGQVGWGGVAAGTLLAAPGVALLGLAAPVRLLVALAALLVVAALFTWYVRRRIGGVTGDCLGFACYLGQVLVLLAAAAPVGG